MTITGRAAWAGWLVIATGLLAGSAVGREIVVAVPARPNMVRLGMDIVHLRGGTLVSYQRAPDTGELVLHRWDSRARTWQDLPLDRFQRGVHADTATGTLYLIGLDSELPPGLAAAGEQAAARVERVPTLLPAEAVNQFNRTLQFNRREWHLLADRYNLEIVDRNEARRRWGRFGPPSGHEPRPDQARLRSEPDEPLAPMPVPDTAPPAESEARPAEPSPQPRPAEPEAQPAESAPQPRPAEPVARPAEPVPPPAEPEPRPAEPKARPAEPSRPVKGVPAPTPVEPDPRPADK